MERLRPLVRVGATSATAEALPTPAAPALAQPVIAPPPAPAATPAPALVDINSAGPEELDRLTGIGPALAARIIEDRRRNGPYRRVDDLERVSGIGPRTVEKLRHQAHVR